MELNDKEFDKLKIKIVFDSRKLLHQLWNAESKMQDLKNKIEWRLQEKK